MYCKVFSLKWMNKRILDVFGVDLILKFSESRYWTVYFLMLTSSIPLLLDFESNIIQPNPRPPFCKNNLRWATSIVIKISLYFEAERDCLKTVIQNPDHETE
jgi:hypothetical protein